MNDELWSLREGRALESILPVLDSKGKSVQKGC